MGYDGIPVHFHQLKTGFFQQGYNIFTGEEKKVIRILKGIIVAEVCRIYLTKVTGFKY